METIVLGLNYSVAAVAFINTILCYFSILTLVVKVKICAIVLLST